MVIIFQFKSTSTLLLKFKGQDQHSVSRTTQTPPISLPRMVLYAVPFTNFMVCRRAMICRFFMYDKYEFINNLKLFAIIFRYQAVQRYIRTCAVMSIVGYVLGLGDRYYNYSQFLNNYSKM